eukprot:gene13475-9642_t
MGLHLTMRRLKAKGMTWPGMRQHVRKFLLQCPTCQSLRVINTAIRALPFVTAAQNPMERISVDTIGPLPKSAKGYEYILVVIDNFSRFVELYPLTSVGATEAAEKLLEYTSRFGQPLQILSDGGTHLGRVPCKGITTAMDLRLEDAAVDATAAVSALLVRDARRRSEELRLAV